MSSGFSHHPGQALTGFVPHVSDQPIIHFANRLRACLDADDTDAALTALIAEREALTQLPRIPRKEWYQEDTPHAIVGLAIALMANALIRANRASEVRQFLDTIADAFWQHRREKPGHNFESLCLALPLSLGAPDGCRHRFARLGKCRRGHPLFCRV